MFARSLFTIIFVTVASVALCSGQTLSKTCGLMIEASPEDSETVIKGIFATIISRENSRIYKSVFRQGRPYFAKVKEGNYKLTLTKAGYKKTIDNISVECDEADGGVFTAYTNMWRGAPTETVEVPSLAVKEIRFERITKLGSTDGSGRGVVVDRVDSQSGLSSSPPPNGSPKSISGGVLNGKAISLPKPEYPPAAMAVRASGAVSVQVLIDENGYVISANAVSGHPLLRAASEAAARQATFSPTQISGQPVKVTGVIVYNFVP